MVNLYDDTRLAEMQSLQNLNTKSLRDQVGENICANCQRLDWDDRQYGLCEQLWILLHADQVVDFDDPNFFSSELWEKYFYPFGGQRVDRNDEWVKGVLATMPFFGPIMVFEFHLKERAEPPDLT